MPECACVSVSNTISHPKVANQTDDADGNSYPPHKPVPISQRCCDPSVADNLLLCTVALCHLDHTCPPGVRRSPRPQALLVNTAL